MTNFAIFNFITLNRMYPSWVLCNLFSKQKNTNVTLKCNLLCFECALVKKHTECHSYNALRYKLPSTSRQISFSRPAMFGT